MQVATDLSFVSFVATANEVAPLPGPPLDRMRLVVFPSPTAEHLDALLPSMVTRIARDRGIDPRFVARPDAEERDALVTAWRGGSLRQLRRFVDRLVQLRDDMAIRQ